MKQKNLILMVVAVGCGLIAAFLTSQMSGRSKEPPQVEIVVAAKELTPGTKFTKDAMKDLLKRRRVNPNDIPQNAFTSEEELDGKTLIKALRSDDFVSQGDLGDFKSIVVPEGKSLVSLKIPVENTTPFVKPTSRVDLLGTLRTETGKVKGTTLIPNMLVMAVDTETVPAPGGVGGRINIQNVTLAASSDEATLIRMAESATIKLSFLLHGDDAGPKSDKPWNVNSVIEWINNAGVESRDTGGFSDGSPSGEGGKTPTVVTNPGIKIWVPKEDIAAGTPLDNMLVENKFQEIDWKGAIPDNVYINIREQIGKYLIKDVFKGFPVAKTAVGDKMPVVSAKANPDNVEPTDKFSPVPSVLKPKDTMDQTFQSPSGMKNYRYEKQEDGKWKLIGEVLPDGTLNLIGGVPLNPNLQQPQPQAPEQKREPRLTRA